MNRKKIIAFMLTTLLVSNSAYDLVWANVTESNLLEVSSSVNPTILNQNSQVLQQDANEAIESERLVGYNNLRISGTNQVDISSDISKIGALEEGTIVVRFKKSTTGIQSLIGISNDATANGHFHLYTNDGVIGYELRSQVGSTTTNLSQQSVSVALNTGFNTVALKVTKGVGYKMFVNGVLAKEIADTNAKLTSGVPGNNKAFIGKTDRVAGSNEYLFSGDIDFIDVYGKAIDDDYLIRKTAQTIKPTEESLLPEGAIKTNPQDIYYPGLLGSSNYRIPAMITTKNAVVITSIDARKGGGQDSPNNIDTAIRRSEDGGKTWDEAKILIDSPARASTIDTSMLQDKETGRVYLLVTHFPDGYGTKVSKMGTGYTSINGVKYRSLYDSSSNLYTIREEGKVYDKTGILTNYIVNEDMDLLENGVKVNNVLVSSSPLKVYGTSYLVMVYSDDDGKTWSKPVDINSQVKADWMKFMGTGPGQGYQIKNGSKAGRIIFPIYYNNVNSKLSSAVIYSDDHGVTWSRGESPNDGRKLLNGTILSSKTLSGGNELTESQVVEMPNGKLKLFMRNQLNTPSGLVAIATSFDGGETWDDVVEFDTNLPEVYCQLSAINYSKKIDGKDAVILSNPSGSGRANGKVRVGLINQNGTYANGEPKYEFEWKYNKLVKPGYYAYSCLSELPNGNIGLFYEGTANQQMSYTEMNLDYLKAEPVVVKTTTDITSVTLQDSDTKYLQGEDINIKLSFDLAVAIMGNRNFALKLGETEVPLTIKPSTNAKDFILTGKIPESMASGKYNVVLKANEAADINNIYNQPLVISEDKNLNTEITLGVTNKTELQLSINRLPTLSEDNYSVDSWLAYSQALKVANDINSNMNALQVDVDTAKINLDKAFNELKVKEVETIIVSQPINLKATTSTNNVVLTWEAPTYIAGLKCYVIYKDGKEVGRVQAGNTTYIDNNLRQNTIYGFKLVAEYTNLQKSKPVSINVRTTVASSIL